MSAQLSEQLCSFWEHESVGIVDEEKTLYNEFQDKVPLPWKEFHEPLTIISSVRDG